MNKTFVGSLEVIESKIVHVTMDNELSIQIDDLNLFVTFINDKDDKSKVKREVVNETTLRIICNNFENSLGEGLLSPLEIGILGGRKLFLSFFVWTPNLSQGRRIINYCLYLEKEHEK